MWVRWRSNSGECELDWGAHMAWGWPFLLRLAAARRRRWRPAFPLADRTHDRPPDCPPASGAALPIPPFCILWSSTRVRNFIACAVSVDVAVAVSCQQLCCFFVQDAHGVFGRLLCTSVFQSSIGLCLGMGFPSCEAIPVSC